MKKLRLPLSWYKANSGKSPHNVGTKSPNAWGLFDLHGNVWEWCRDSWECWYGKFSGDPITDPAGPAKGRFKIYRGGGWFAGASYQRCASRMRAKPDSKSPDIGFRVARSGSRKKRKNEISTQVVFVDKSN